MLAELSGRVAVITDVEPGALKETVELTLASGGEALAVPTDVTDSASVAALADAAYDAFGAVHLLCNNAGVFQAGLLWERTEADWEWVLGVNLWGVIHGIRAFVPRMLAGGEPGHVVNTSSLAGVVSNAYSGPYTTSKFAVLGLSESLAHDLEATGAAIGASVLIPGSVATRIADSVRNRPSALADGQGAEDATFVDGMLAQTAAKGKDPVAVADMVLDAVRKGTFLIPTTESYAAQITHRAEALLARQAPRAFPFD
jgi:NAD(P)-dependent dehydrogenase (short-subunit alcohol dehydrogenase family)